MKIVGRAGDFLAALTPSVRIAPAKSPIDILTHVLVRAGEDGVYVIANDLDKESRIRAPVSVARAGSVVIPREAEAFLKRLKADAPFEMAVEDKVAKLTSGRARCSLPTLEAEDFPLIGDGEFTSEFKIDAAALARALGEVDFAMSTSETSYSLCGVCVVSGEKLTFAATDGTARLSVSEIDVRTHEEFKVIIPDRTVKEIRTWTGAGDTTALITVSISDRLIRFAMDGRILISKIIEGTFPSYERVIPKEFSAEAMIDRGELIGAFNLVSVSLDTHSGVKLNLSSDGLMLTAKSGAGKESSTVIENPQHEGEEIETGVNAKYAVAALSAMAGENVRIRLTPQHLVFDDPQNAGQLIVTMSMRA